MNLLIFFIFLIVFVILVSTLLYKSNKTGGVEYIFDNSAPIADINSYDLTKFILSDIYLNFSDKVYNDDIGIRANYEFYMTLYYHTPEILTYAKGHDNISISGCPDNDAFAPAIEYLNKLVRPPDIHIYNLARSAIAETTYYFKNHNIFNKCIYMTGGNYPNLMNKNELLAYIDIVYSIKLRSDDLIDMLKYCADELITIDYEKLSITNSSQFSSLMDALTITRNELINTLKQRAAEINHIIISKVDELKILIDNNPNEIVDLVQQKTIEILNQVEDTIKELSTTKENNLEKHSDLQLVKTRTELIFTTFYSPILLITDNMIELSGLLEIYKYMCFIYPNVTSVLNTYIFNKFEACTMLKNYTNNTYFKQTQFGTNIYYNSGTSNVDSFLHDFCSYSSYFNNGDDVIGIFKYAITKEEIEHGEILKLHECISNYARMNQIVRKYGDNIKLSKYCTIFMDKMKLITADIENLDDYLQHLYIPLFIFHQSSGETPYKMFMLLNMGKADIEAYADRLYSRPDRLLWNSPEIKFHIYGINRVQIKMFVSKINIPKSIYFGYKANTILVPIKEQLLLPNAIYFIKWAMGNGISKSVINAIMVYGATRYNYTVNDEISALPDINSHKRTEDNTTFFGGDVIHYEPLSVFVFQTELDEDNRADFYYSIFIYVNHAKSNGIVLSRKVHHIYGEAINYQQQYPFINCRLMAGILHINEFMELDILNPHEVFSVDYYDVYKSVYESQKLNNMLKYAYNQKLEYYRNIITTDYWFYSQVESDSFDYFLGSFKSTVDIIIEQLHLWDNTGHIFLCSKESLLATYRLLKNINHKLFINLVYYKLAIYSYYINDSWFMGEYYKYLDIITSVNSTLHNHPKLVAYMLLQFILSKQHIPKGLQSCTINYLLNLVYKWTELPNYAQGVFTQNYSWEKTEYEELFNYIKTISTPLTHDINTITCTPYAEKMRRIYSYDFDANKFIYRHLWCDFSINPKNIQFNREKIEYY